MDRRVAINISTACWGLAQTERKEENMLPIVEDVVKQLWRDFTHPLQCYQRFRTRWDKLAKERQREVSLGGGEPITDSTTISIVVPAYNEEKHVEETLRAIDTEHALNIEVVVVDGGSSDKTASIAESVPGVRVLRCPQPSSRSRSMNFGAENSTGDVILFLHADTVLPENYGRLIRTSMKEESNVLGAFRFAIDKSAPYRTVSSRTLTFVETLVNFRARFLKMPYGDQALFMRRHVYNEFGGFPDQPFMEDFELVRQLGYHGSVDIVDAPATTSVRRWENLGIWTTTVTNQFVIFAYFWGMTPSQIHNWYYPKKNE